MKIEIEGYTITSDDNNITLSEKKIVQEGKTKGTEKFKTIGHFSSLELLFQALFKLKVRRSTATSLKQLKKDIEMARIEICYLWEGV